MNLQIWGGVECTVNRVGDQYLDQMAKSGHWNRVEDLDRFADLDIRTLRYPVLWEKIQASSPDEFDWTWSDERLERLRELGISPIIGLLHHGSGPLWTNLLDPRFPQKFAAFALAVARRYPWIDAYTPINEPLTTARFSGLYGHWYPHRKDEASFHKILFNEIEATILAMQAVRSVNPSAKLIQTEDLGKVFSARGLSYQADFENERRWLSFDLLSGQFSEKSFLWKFVTEISEGDFEQLQRIRSSSCPPDTYGINYYLTSERFLDDDLEKHPPEAHGGNFYHRYADVAAVRVRPEGLVGSETLVTETYQRYRRPVAITEVHLGCTREEQLRWLMEEWNTGQRLLRKGIPIVAITTWALLGAYDWNTLVTRESGTYEPGAFDARSTPPRLTALGRATRSLCRSNEFRHPVLDVQGWWRRPERFLTGVQFRAPNHDARLILVLGGEGILGKALGRICDLRGLPHKLLSRRETNICQPESIASAVRLYRPWAVINAAGYTRIDAAEKERANCFAVNTQGAAMAAGVCRKEGLPFATISSDLVFDGEKMGAYDEGDAPRALSAYGSSKEKAEEEVSRRNPNALILRTSPLFGPWSLPRFLASVLRNRRATVPEGDTSPTYIPDLGHALLDLLIDGESGIWHLANQGRLSWSHFVRIVCSGASIPLSTVKVVSRESLPARRPLQSALCSRRGVLMPSLENALSRFRNEVLPLSALLEGHTFETAPVHAESPSETLPLCAPLC